MAPAPCSRLALVFAAVSIATAGCGRLSFDVLGEAGATNDDANGDGASGIPATSCIGLSAMCGVSGDCCESPLIPGGTFARSFDNVGDGMFADASFIATLSDFRLDTYEVTVARFRQFVTAGQGTQVSPPAPGAGAHPQIAGSGWDASWNPRLAVDTPTFMVELSCDGTYQIWTDAPGANEDRPINCVSWYAAMAFCAWDGGFVPSEAEWNYVASGGDEQRAYPWSQPPESLTIDDTYASYNVDATKQCFGDGINGCSRTDLLVVGSKPAGNGRWGQADLAGNVWEWTLDWWTNPYPQNPCDNCANLTQNIATSRVWRGGGFFHGDIYIRNGVHNFGQSPNTRTVFGGLRCARSP